MACIHHSSDNSAVEQTAATSRSWQTGIRTKSAAEARQERAAPPLLTASVGRTKKG
jgi:hypothetical protein